MLRRITGRLPTADWLLNHVVARIPYTNTRMRAYAHDWREPRRAHARTAQAQLQVIDLHHLWLKDGAIVGKQCVLDARGTLTLCRNVNLSGGVRHSPAHML